MRGKNAKKKAKKRNTWEGNYNIVGENYNSVHATPPLTSSAVEYSNFTCCGSGP